MADDLVSSSLATRLIRIAAMILIAGGCCAMLAGCLPFGTLQSIGDVIRRPEDVTWERYVRYLIACWSIGLWSVPLGLLIYRQRRYLGSWFSDTVGSLPGKLTAPTDRESRWGVEVWGVVTLGIALRLMRMNDPVAYDEAYTFLNFASRPWYAAIGDYNSTTNHLLNTFLMHWSYRLFGDAEWVLRLPVMLAGVATLLLTYLWSAQWLGRRVALVAVSLVSVSPLMITYSADARGYMFVTACALALDHAAALIGTGWQKHHGAWITLVVAATLGLWAVPIMLYPILSTAIWLLGSTWLSQRSRGDDSQNFMKVVRGSLSAAALVVLFVGLFYTPAFIFRGTQFLHDPIMASASSPRELIASLGDVWRWWVAGVIPPAIWGVFLIIGLLLWPRTSRDVLRLASPFAVVLILNLVQRSAPPPRVYLFLFPWIALIAANGAVRGARMLIQSRRAARIEQRAPAWALSAAICFLGGRYATAEPVIFDRPGREDYLSLRDALTDLKSRISSSRHEVHRLFVPLPCDLPARFYTRRDDVPVVINDDPVENSDRVGLPTSGQETLWILTHKDEAPEAVLRSPLIDRSDLADVEFREITTFRTLRLFQSARP